ncbi:MAG TPA: FAD-dependent monooxygenase [Ktedonobacterales bacterium]
MPAVTETYDAVVVGASFAGLAFAGAAAARGLRVLVVERDAEVGRVVRTTGVLFSDVLDVMDVPSRFLMNSVRRVRIAPPGRSEPIEIASQAYRFYMADVTGMLRWMAEEAQARGAEIRCATPFVDAARDADTDGTTRVSLGGPSAQDGGGSASRAASEAVAAKLLVGADGARSRVAERMELDRNRRFLAGAEWLVEGVELERDTFYLVMDHELAPGYCAWLAPHGEVAALGVAGTLRAFSPSESLRAARAAFKGLADVSAARVVERKAGVIPVGGRLKHVYRDDARGHALLLGDAAGLCGAATGGGIYPALLTAKLAAHAAANQVGNGQSGAIAAYLKDLAHAGRLGQYLQIEDWIRRVLDRMGSNADVALLYGLFAPPEGRRVLQQTLLETPIISMDGSFFGVVRALLSKHPRIYGAAVKAAWRRVTTRG